LVINSLLEKEGLSGQVQMIYIDPPYGIRYGSNFQPFVKKPKSQTEKDEDLTAEPEQIRAFRDTWELGIHSYLAYLRDRLLLARELLRESGSCFVQIGDENVHRVGMVLDDIFGAENRMATISFATTSGSSTSHLPQVADYLLWYAKDKDKAKYHQLYEPLTRAETIDYFSSWASVELPDGGSRKPTDEERFNPDKYLPKGARMYQRIGLDSQDASTTGRSKPYEWKGRIFHCGKNRHWSISINGLNRLAELGRLEALEGKDSLRWKKYEDEIPGRRINNIWERMYPREKRYVVETSTKAIQRCLLMTTDPGDLVFDPTCGSGATAYVAEQWGRRWITCDTSRVALTLAKSRVMTAVYDYYELAHAQEGVGSGFKYKTVSNVSPSILANDAPSPTITLYDQPLVDKTKTRVAGPFTVEAVPAPTVKPLEAIEDLAPLPADESISRTGETHRQGDWRDELLKTGIRGKAGQRISFARLEPLPGTRWLHANGETRPDAAGAEVFRDPGTAYNPERVVVSFGPDHAPLEQRQIALAIEDAQTRPRAENHRLCSISV
jgi:adenine-specific DNA-methyltransferase